MLHIQPSFFVVVFWGWVGGDCFEFVFVSSSFVLFTFLMYVAHSAIVFGGGGGDCFKFVSSSFVLFTFLMCVAHSAFFFGGGGV